MKTITKFNWEDGEHIQRTLSRSFNTLEEAQAFAAGKRVNDIYKCNGKYKVEWIEIKRLWED